jgi:Ig-like domain from next to BRCA1 gene
MGAAASVAVPSNVAPNATVDITVPMTAPSAAGTYRGDWRLRNASNAPFGDQIYVQIVVTAPVDDGAFFLDVTVPDNTQFTAGASFTKTWRLRNTGTTTWSTAYRLYFITGNQMGGGCLSRYPL